MQVQSSALLRALSESKVGAERVSERSYDTFIVTRLLQGRKREGETADSISPRQRRGQAPQLITPYRPPSSSSGPPFHTSLISPGLAGGAARKAFSRRASVPRGRPASISRISFK